MLLPHDATRETARQHAHTEIDALREDEIQQQRDAEYLATLKSQLYQLIGAESQVGHRDERHQRSTLQQFDQQIGRWRNRIDQCLWQHDAQETPQWRNVERNGRLDLAARHALQCAAYDFRTIGADVQSQAKHGDREGSHLEIEWRQRQYIVKPE